MGFVAKGKAVNTRGGVVTGDADGTSKISPDDLGPVDDKSATDEERARMKTQREDAYNALVERGFVIDTDDDPYENERKQVEAEAAEAEAKAAERDKNVEKKGKKRAPRTAGDDKQG